MCRRSLRRNFPGLAFTPKAEAGSSHASAARVLREPRPPSASPAPRALQPVPPPGGREGSGARAQAAGRRARDARPRAERRKKPGRGLARRARASPPPPPLRPGSAASRARTWAPPPTAAASAAAPATAGGGAGWRLRSLQSASGAASERVCVF